MKCISLFKCNPQIEVIDKSHCSLEDVPNFQNYSRSLEELFLDANKLTVLNENVFRLTKLRRFSFSDNIIEDIPPDIAKLINLVELDCSKNIIHVIPEQIKFLRGLQICDFSRNNIEYLPAGLVQLKNLTCLTLNSCRIRHLPDDIGQLKNLESLELRENSLLSLPASITQLESLRKLDVGRNHVSELPEDIGRLTKLEYLLLDEVRLVTLPPKIGRLKNLQCLDLSKQDRYRSDDYEDFMDADPLAMEHRRLSHLPEQISGLVSLTDLDVSENALYRLPDGIGDLKNLTNLKADNNYLSEINPNIGGCTALQELVLTYNQISELPSSIGSLVELESLYVNSNSITELPTQIGNLKNLRILSVRDNWLKSLPSELGQLEMIRIMDLCGNRLQNLPITLTSLNLKALWLSKNQAQPLPKLQIDELSDGQRVLTCYLLPQQAESAQVQQIMSKDPEIEHNHRPPAVSFDTAAIDDTELSNDANFVRHDTPFPRDLKARHQKLFGNTPAKPELKGHDNASFTLADNPRSRDRDSSSNATNVAPQHKKSTEYDSNGLEEGPRSTSQMISKTKMSTFSQIEYETRSPEKTHPSENGSFGESKNRLQMREFVQEPKRDMDAEDRFRQEVPHNSACYTLDIHIRISKHHKPGLGLSIAGGKDTPPYKDNDEGIFVSKITPGGPAEAAGVKVGDKILAVNNNIFYDGITHQRAVEIFKKVKPENMEFTMRVLRDPNDPGEDDKMEDEHSEDAIVSATSKIVDRSTVGSPTLSRAYTIAVASDANGIGGRPYRDQGRSKQASTLPPGASLLDSTVNKNIVYTTLVKDFKHDLGLVLENRSDDEDSRSSNIVISRIKPNSIAFMDGKLQVDDRLLSINGSDVTGVDLERIMMMLEGTERFIRIVVSRGDGDDPISQALRSIPARPALGGWFSSTSNIPHRPSLIESYQRPTFGSISSLQKQPSVSSVKPPKPPKPSHLMAKDSDSPSPSQYDDSPIVRSRARGSTDTPTGYTSSQIIDSEKRSEWRRERLKSIDNDMEVAKAIAEAQRRQREGN